MSGRSRIWDIFQIQKLCIYSEWQNMKLIRSAILFLLPVPAQYCGDSIFLQYFPCNRYTNHHRHILGCRRNAFWILNIDRRIVIRHLIGGPRPLKPSRKGEARLRAFLFQKKRFGGWKRGCQDLNLKRRFWRPLWCQFHHTPQFRQIEAKFANTYYFLASLCLVCLRSVLQNLLNSNLPSMVLDLWLR